MASVKCIHCEKETESVNVLPCLHCMCGPCVLDYFDRSDNNTHFLPCPECGIKIQIPKSGTSSFKTFQVKDKGDKIKSTKSSINDKDEQKFEITLTPGPGGERETDEYFENKNVIRKFACVTEQTENDITIKFAWNGKPTEECDRTEINTRNSIAADGGGNNQDGANNVSEADDTTNQCYLPDSVSELSKECDKSIIQTQKDYINELLGQVDTSMRIKGQQINQLDILVQQLEEVKHNAELELEERAKYLCQLINKRKEKLKIDINDICNKKLKVYNDNQIQIRKQLKTFNDAHHFAESVINSNDSQAIINLHNDISGRLLDLIHTQKSAVDIFNIKLDIPDRGKEEVHLSKLYGQFLNGTINCGTAEMISSFDIELSWPSSLITTKLNDFVVVGKTGAFETNGRVMFCDSHGHLKGNHGYPEGMVPLDAASLQDGSILVSDNHGQITHFSVYGNVLETWKNKFKGSGKMATTSLNEIVITSSEEQCIYKYNRKGELVEKYPKEGSSSVFQHPHGVAIDSKDRIIVADYRQNCILWVDPSGHCLQKYYGDASNSNQLRCPSAVCCDPFNNVLVADFTNDTVHLVSSSGEFLGYLLTKDNDMSCPNFLTLSPDGLLFVGQYGGQIQVFRYLSCARQA